MVHLRAGLVKLEERVELQHRAAQHTSSGFGMIGARGFKSPSRQAYQGANIRSRQAQPMYRKIL